VIPGHAESEIPPQVRMGVARGPDAFRQKAELAVAGGADLIKVIASGAVLAYGGVPGEPEMTPEEIAAVVEVAHRHGLKVAAHAHGARSIREAILAGADTIEHASLIDDAAIALAREHDVALSMDVYNGSYIDTAGREQGWPEEFLRKNLETTEAQRDGFRRAHAALGTGGLLIFDVAEVGLDRGRAPACREGEGWACLVRFAYDDARQRLTRHITTFRRIGASYRRREETHHVQLYRASAVARELREAGFRVRTVRRFGEYPLPPGRVGFLARKA